MFNLRPFHAAYPVTDLSLVRNFYQGILGCNIGRFTDNWIDVDFFGHQLVFHKANASLFVVDNVVDKKNVPVPHFGIIINWNDWDLFVSRLKNHKINFIIAPHTRFLGKAGEQKACFFKDPNGLNLEFKTFKSDSMIFQA
ncbi:MAG: VOC family protein [Rickettsiales bacterium]|nr:VOC family protein [Rickettsiales bacterium]